MPSLMTFDPNAIGIEEISAARQVLVLSGLPVEIADTILNFAEYWCRQHYSCKIPLTVRAGRWLIPESSSLYLQTGPLGYGIGLDELSLVKPRKVVFRITGRDQACETTNDRYGTYQRHFSWFEASIFREDESWSGDREEPIQALITAAPDRAMQGAPEIHTLQGKEAQAWRHHPLFYVGYNPDELPPWVCRDRFKMLGGFRLVGNGKKLMWLLQRNRMGWRDFVEHKIEWKEERTGEESLKEEKTYEEYKREESSKKIVEEEWPINGAGTGRNFIASLQRGDRIGVWARAMGVNSLNHVQSVEVDVYFFI